MLDNANRKKILEVKNIRVDFGSKKKKFTAIDGVSFDIYEGENLPENKKSVALSVTFQPKEQTFTDKDIENLMNKIIVEVGKKTGGELRN